MDVNDNQPRGLLFCYSDLISFCYQGIGIILFCSLCSQHMLSLQKSTYLCAKVRKSHLRSMRLTTGRDSSHDPIRTILTAERSLTHMHYNNKTHPQGKKNKTCTVYLHQHTPFTLLSVVTDVPTRHRAPGQRLTLDRICSTFVILYSSTARLVH